MSSEDTTYERQIVEANKLGNSLLSGLILEGFAENKKNVKIFGNLKSLHDIVFKYKNEVTKLK